MNNGQTLTSKPKLEVLDALRGFCALMVILLHFSENYIPTHRFFLMPHGCLPVEYFFILTGFVLVYAYDGRWSQGLTIGRFLKRRILRLHPLVVVGSIIGAACYVIASEHYVPCVPHLSLGELGVVTLWCCTMLPVLPFFGCRWLHPMQGPLWTLFYIYLANVLYAFVLRHLKTWALVVLAVASVGLTYYFGMLYGGFHGGPAWEFWSHNDTSRTLAGLLKGPNASALARMAFPVLAGMVIARQGWKIRAGKWSLWLCIAILSFIFFAPEMRNFPFAPRPIDSPRLLAWFGLAPSKCLNGGFEATAVVVGMPLVLLLGIGGEIKNSTLAAICRFLGKYSFPLYCTHYPLTLIQRIWRDAHLDAPWQWHLAAVCAFAFFAFANGWVAMKITDWFAARVGK